MNGLPMNGVPAVSYVLRDDSRSLLTTQLADDDWILLIGSPTLIGRDISFLPFTCCIQLPCYNAVILSDVSNSLYFSPFSRQVVSCRLICV